MFRRPLTSITPDQAVERLVDAWKDDPAKVAWCNAARPDLPVEVMLGSHARALWFSVDPLSQLSRVPPARIRRVQDDVIQTFADQPFETWKIDGEAHDADEPFPWETRHQRALAIAARAEWQGIRRS